MPTLTERAFIYERGREKFCSETLNFRQARSFLVELVFFFVFVALNRVVLTMTTEGTTFAAAPAKNNERRKKKTR